METTGTSTIVLDANVAVWAVFPVVASVDTSPLFLDWNQQRIRLVAPALWLSECVSAIRQAIYARRATADDGELAIGGLFDLGIETIPLDHQLCVDAYLWAARLRQAQAYDAFYLALAEKLGADFWTADGHLANGARQIGVTWIHLVE